MMKYLMQSIHWRIWNLPDGLSECLDELVHWEVCGQGRIAAIPPWSAVYRHTILPLVFL